MVEIRILFREKRKFTDRLKICSGNSTTNVIFIGFY